MSRRALLASARTHGLQARATGDVFGCQRAEGGTAYDVPSHSYSRIARIDADGATVFCGFGVFRGNSKKRIAILFQVRNTPRCAFGASIQLGGFPAVTRWAASSRMRRRASGG